MERLFILPHANEKSEPATVWKKASAIAVVTTFTIKRTVTSAEIPLCPKGFPMKQAAVELKKRRIKYRCPKITCKDSIVQCTCQDPCSDAAYGRNVHLVLKDNPRLFNNPPRNSAQWKLEYNARALC